jgi:hypothetical protein
MDQMTIKREGSREAAPRDSLAMLAALGILAYAASMMTHEALGHGGYCLAVGGHSVLLTAWEESCDFPGVPPLAVKAAGPLAQLAAGLLAWLILRHSAPKGARPRYLLWMYMVFNLFISSSYVAFSGVSDFGDAAELIAGHQPRIVWQTGLVLLGLVIYALSIQATALEFREFTNRDGETSRLYRLVWVPYLSAGVFACCTAALNQTMEHQTMKYAAAIGLASLSSFGSGAGLFCLPAAQRRMTSQHSSPADYVRWSAGWGIAAALVIAIFLLLTRPGPK